MQISLALKRGQSHVALYSLGFLLGKISPASSQEEILQVKL